MLKQLKRIIPYLENLGVAGGLRFIVGKRTGAMDSYSFNGLKHAVQMRPGTSDEAVFAQIFVKREYDIKFGFEPRIIIDGGANIGFFSVYMKNRYPNAQIIAVEPDAGNFEVLKKNTAHYDGIHLKKAGLWPKQARTKMVDKHGLGNWGLVTEEVSDESSGPGDVVMATVDDLLAEFNLPHIDILKLDIESAEKQLFSENYMSWLSKTRIILIELHDWMEPGCSRSFFTAINEAFSNYSFYQVGENSVISNLGFRQNP